MDVMLFTIYAKIFTTIFGIHHGNPLNLLNPGSDNSTSINSPFQNQALLYHTKPFAS
ncbi:hypothetical protein CLV51_11078 [Chitinophaga niastensis]|uniref:Uncharacterized protein n=1 Tax=Chitinophaga niastensis TaxID=536980 RepID=A0A2P8H9I7_CHINA|nr:hypothetical protein CLV51_11078 [Chitinophaga niastensis]